MQAVEKNSPQTLPPSSKKFSATRPREIFSLEGKRTLENKLPVSRAGEKDRTGPRSLRRLIVECPEGGCHQRRAREVQLKGREKRVADQVPAENNSHSTPFKKRERKILEPMYDRNDHEGGERKNI